MSIYSLQGLGTTVFGGPFVGWVSQHWTPRIARGGAGVATALTAVVLLASGATTHAETPADTVLV